jgi:predicted kinase
MRTHKTLIMTVGLPRSGKSTWARNNNFPMVNPDSIRLAVHGQDFVKDAEKMIWTMAHYMVKALFIAGHDKVILDATNTTFTQRESWRSPLWTRTYEIFSASPSTCIDRAKKDQREDLVPIIKHMAEQFEPVEDDEWDHP